MGFQKDLLELARKKAKHDTDIFPIFVQLLLERHHQGVKTLYGDVRATGLPPIAKLIRAS